MAQKPVGERKLRVVDGKIIEEAPINKQKPYQYPNIIPASHDIVPQGAISLNIIQTGTTCETSNGSIIIQATGGTPPYRFTLTDPYGYAYTQNTGNFQYLTAHTYSIQVTDANGQTALGSATLTNTLLRPKLSIGSFQVASDCVSNDAKVTLSVTGGTPPYEYSLDAINWQTSNVFSNLNAGFYYFLVRDANGCTGATSNFLQGVFYPSTCVLGVGGGYSQSACGQNGNISFGVHTGPNPPYTYSMDGINFSTSGDFSGLPPGVHLIYFKDALGNLQKFSISIYEYCEVLINALSMDASCQQNNGAITVSTQNGTPPYTFSLDGINFQSSNTFNSLAPGNYTVTVKDNYGVQTSGSITVYDKCPDLSLSATGTTCAGHDGKITATANRGTPPYSYSIDGVNFQPSPIFNGIDPGTYTITLKDALGFKDSAQVFVGNSCLPILLIPTRPGCNQPNGSISVFVNGGTAPFLYSLDGVHFQVSNLFSNLPAGPYTVVVLDRNGLQGESTITLTDASPTIQATATSASCLNNDGIITMNGNHGTPPYQFSIDGVNFSSSTVFNNLASGDYVAWIKDVLGCKSNIPITVPSDCPIVSAVASDETCGSANGTITLTGSHGKPPYIYSIDGINFQSSPIFSGLSAGNYVVTIEDALAIRNTAGITLQNICPNLILTPHNGYCDTAIAFIEATGSNGYPPYQYSIDGTNFQNSNQFTGLADGQYVITIKDSRGLIQTDSVTVQNFPGPELTGNGLPSSCLADDGMISLFAISGNPPYQYSLDSIHWQNTSQFSGVAPGTYFANIVDANGCPASAPIVVLLNNNLNLQMPDDAQICEGSSVSLQTHSNASLYSWSPSNTLDAPNQSTPIASPHQTTRYYLQAQLGVCALTDSVLIQVNPAPLAFAGPDTSICFGQEISLHGSGGINYEWSPGTYLNDPNIQNPLVRDPVKNITYSLWVTDSLGCRSLSADEMTVFVTPMPALFAGNDTSIVRNQPFQLQAVDLNGSGFTQYSWSPPTGLSDPQIPNPIVTIPQDMTYTVTAQTDEGCTGIGKITLKVHAGPDIYVPNAFTPNHDSHNDVLKAIPVGIKKFLYFAVFNRWGERIFYSSSPEDGWDGTWRGKLQEAATYVWMTAGIDDTGQTITRRGTVVLIR